MAVSSRTRPTATFSLNPQVIAGLRAQAVAEDDNVSRVAERAIRAYLAAQQVK